MTDSLQHALTTVVAFGPKLIGFVQILLIGWFIAKMAPKMFAKAIGKGALSPRAEVKS